VTEEYIPMMISDYHHKPLAVNTLL